MLYYTKATVENTSGRVGIESAETEILARFRRKEPHAVKETGGGVVGVKLRCFGVMQERDPHDASGMSRCLVSHGSYLQSHSQLAELRENFKKKFGNSARVIPFRKLGKEYEGVVALDKEHLELADASSSPVVDDELLEKIDEMCSIGQPSANRKDAPQPREVSHMAQALAILWVLGFVCISMLAYKVQSELTDHLIKVQSELTEQWNLIDEMKCRNHWFLPFMKKTCQHSKQFDQADRIEAVEPSGASLPLSSEVMFGIRAASLSLLWVQLSSDGVILRCQVGYYLSLLLHHSKPSPKRAPLLPSNYTFRTDGGRSLCYFSGSIERPRLGSVSQEKVLFRRRNDSGYSC